MNLEALNERLRDLVESLDFDPDMDANDVDAYGMDAMTRKRLKVKRLHKHPVQGKARPPRRNRVPMGLRSIKAMSTASMRKKGR